jgi:hypothetical protein
MQSLIARYFSLVAQRKLTLSTNCGSFPDVRFTNSLGFSTPHNSCESHPSLSNLRLIHSARGITRVVQFHHNHHSCATSGKQTRRLPATSDNRNRLVALCLCPLALAIGPDNILGFSMSYLWNFGQSWTLFRCINATSFPQRLRHPSDMILDLNLECELHNPERRVRRRSPNLIACQRLLRH